MTRKRAQWLSDLLHKYQDKIMTRGDRAAFRWHRRRGYVINSPAPHIYGLRVTERGRMALEKAIKSAERHRQP